MLGPQPSLTYVDYPDPSPDEIAEWQAYDEDCRAEFEEPDGDES
jgi:hypothetical protein